MNWTVPGYTETRELGSGASGRVVLALHQATGTPVAIKYLSDELRSDPDFLQEFRAEARLLGDLESPYVVRMFEYVEGPAGAAIVMELVDGIALRALLRQAGATGPEAALVVLKGSLLGLAAAHELGVVHRDYKPENVLVAADGSSKLVDFGIAVKAGEDGGIAGTPPYMAPEQWTGGAASPAADVYAATATFFECLTGSRPFPGVTFAELVVQHTEAPIPDEQAPEAVRPLIRRGLAKAAAERPESAAEFVAELEAVAGAAYGPQWEETGRKKLAALAALLPLLFPSATGDVPGVTSALAQTTLRPPERTKPPRLIRKRRLLYGGVAAGLGVVLIGGVAAGVSTGRHHLPGHPIGDATPVALTSFTPGGSPTPVPTSPSPAPTSAGPSPSASSTSAAPSSAPPKTAAPTTHAPTTPPPTTSHPATSAPPTSASPSPTPPITVPNVLGESVGTAQQNLIAAGFTKDHINVVYDYQCSARHLGVYAQDPAGGSQVPKGSSVALTAMASSCLLYRDELGADWSKAQADLKSAGFTNVSVVGPNGPCNYGPWGTITAQSPGYQRQYLPSSAAITLTAQSCQIG